MGEKSDKQPHNKKLIIILISIITILALIIIIGLIIVPVVNNYTLRNRNLGMEIALRALMQKASQCQNPVAITIDNKTINLVAIECLQNNQ